MNPKLIWPLLAGALMLSLTACAPAAEADQSADASVPSESLSPSPVLPAEAPSAQSVSSETPPAASSPPEPKESALVQTADNWLEAYHLLLEDLEHSVSQEELDLYGDRWREVSIYDVDMDDIPELFFTNGYCEADFETVCYAFRNGRAEAIGQFQSGHTVLYSTDLNSVLVWTAHMGYSDIYEYRILEDGQLTCLRTVFSEGYVPAYLPYRDITDFFPDAQPLPQYFGTFSEIWDSIFADWSEQA